MQTQTKIIKARFLNGVFKPLERVKIADNQEFFITLQNKTINEDENFNNSSLASFSSDWDNKKDSIYDNWKEEYKIFL